MKYDRFEDLPVWKSVIDLALAAFGLTDDRTFNFQGDPREVFGAVDARAMTRPRASPT